MAGDIMFKMPGVSGVLCADENGLCLGAKGVAKKEAAGHITSIALSAAKLIPKSNTNPVICIEGETGSVLIKKEENIVMAVYKSQA